MASLGPWHGGRIGSDTFDPFMMSLLYHGGSSAGRQGHRRHDATTTAIASVNVEWRETDNAHVFCVDLPGVKKEDLRVRVEDGNVLQMSGERSKEQEEKTDRWHLVERHCGSFGGQFWLPENAELDGIKCGFADGVLTVTVPKKEVEEKAAKTARSIDVAECLEDAPGDVSDNTDVDECVQCRL